MTVFSPELSQPVVVVAIKRILIIHRDNDLVQALRQNLERDGHDVLVEPEGAWGVAQARKFNPDLVITDLGVVEAGDQALLRQLRMVRDDVPVLILSPRAEESTRIRGFRLGLDDFLVQPVGVSELHRRIDALLGHSARPSVLTGGATDSVVRFGNVEIHVGQRTVIRDGSPVSLRLKEFDLLMTLVARKGRVASRADLLREVWGYRTWVATRTVDTHVAELRRKLELNPARPQHILTVRKVGYRLQPDQGEAALHH
jgi:DNA-binding response OmpR family regulator